MGSMHISGTFCHKKPLTMVKKGEVGATGSAQARYFHPSKLKGQVSKMMDIFFNLPQQLQSQATLIEVGDKEAEAHDAVENVKNDVSTQNSLPDFLWQPYARPIFHIS